MYLFLWSGIFLHLQRGKTQACICLFVFSPASLPSQTSSQYLPHPPASFVWLRWKLNRAEPDLSCLTHTRWQTQGCICLQTLPVWSCTSSNLLTLAASLSRGVPAYLSLLFLCEFARRDGKESRLLAVSSLQIDLLWEAAGHCVLAPFPSTPQTVDRPRWII